MNLTPDYLTGWEGRFRHPKLWVEAEEAVHRGEGSAADGSNSESGTDGIALDHIAAALLKDLAAGLDEPRALAYLLEQGELPLALSFIEDSPWLRGDPAAAQEVSRRLRRRQREVAEQVLDAIEFARGRAVAAGVTVPDLPPIPGEDVLLRLPTTLQQIADANERLDKAIEDARSEAEERTGDKRRALSDVLLSAWRQRISRGQLVTADRLLAAGGEDVLTPDTVPPLPPWDPTVDGAAALERMRRSKDPGWSSDPAGQNLLQSYRDLVQGGSSLSADAFCSALVEFLGGQPARAPRPYAGGHLFRLDLSSVGQHVPLSWLSDLRIVIRTDDQQFPRAVAAEDRLIVVNAASGASSRRERSNQAVLGAEDLIRLSSVREHRALQLLRLAGRSWTAHAAGVGNAQALAAYLDGPQPLAWIRLAWLVDVLGIGGAELTRELTNETGIHPAGLNVLLDLLLRSNRDISRGDVARHWQSLDARSRLIAAVLPSAAADPESRIVFLAALAADGFDSPLQLADLELSIAVEGGAAPASLLERGMTKLARHQLTEVTDEGVRLLRCGILNRLREDAPAMLMEMLGALNADAPANQMWTRHRWALLSDGDIEGNLEDLLRRRLLAIHKETATHEANDAIAVVDLVAGDLKEVHPWAELDLDLPNSAPTAARPEALRTILVELLQNAIDELAAVGRAGLRIAVRTEGNDVIIDVVDDGNGLRGTNPHAVLRPDRHSKAGTPGRSLPDIELLARQINGQLVLVTPARADPSNGAHFRLTVPRGQFLSS